METITEICKFRGNAEWVARGRFFYSSCRHRGSTVNFRCGTPHCSARFLIRAGVPGPLIGEHNHPEEPWIPNRNRMFTTLRERSIAETTSLQMIYEEEAMRYPDAAPHLLFEGVLPSMRKWRRSTQPAVPRTLQNYATTLTADPRFRGLYAAPISAAGGGVDAVILAMPGFETCLRDSQVIIADGTFLTVPAGLPACQVLTLHAVVDGQFYHPVVAIMNNRRQPVYEAVLRHVWREAGQLQSISIISDFEPGLQAALRNVAGVPVSGCYFHFIQALMRRARRERIHVGSNTPGGRLVRMYAALALLPAARAPAALAELQAAAEAQHLPFSPRFHEYFTSFWMTQIGPEAFSVYGRPHRTSNVAESFHAYLRRMLGPSPNVWRFTQVIQAKFNTCSSRRQAQLAGNGPPPRRSRTRTIVRMATTMNNISALERGTITLQNFLVATSRAIDVSSDDILIDDVPEVALEVVVDEDLEVVDENVRAASPDIELPNAPVTVPTSTAPHPVACGVCFENFPQRVLVPCGHALCSECVIGIQESDTPNRCAFCRAYIQNCIQLYL